MSKTPFSADYIHKLLKSIPESEREKFLVMLATQPVTEPQPASGSAGPPDAASQAQPPASSPQTLDEFCDTVAQEAYTQPASPAALPPKQGTSAPAPPLDPAAAAKKPAGTAARKPTVAQKQPPPKPVGPPAADPAQAGPPKFSTRTPLRSLPLKVHQVNLNVHPFLLQMLPLPELVPSSTPAQAIPRFASYNSGRAGRSAAPVKTLSVRRRFQTAATAFTLCTAVGTAKELKAGPALLSKLPLPARRTGSIPTGSGTRSGTPTLGHPLGARKMDGKKAGTKGGISDQPRFGSAVKIHVE